MTIMWNGERNRLIDWQDDDEQDQRIAYYVARNQIQRSIADYHARIGVIDHMLRVRRTLRESTIATQYETALSDPRRI